MADAPPSAMRIWALHDVDAGDFLRHRVLDLDARIDLDEIELAGVAIHQELGGACVDIAFGAGQTQRCFAEPRCAGRRPDRARGALDDLLVAPLYGAVPFEQMHYGAMMVAQQLDLHMAGAAHQLFQIDFPVAEGGFRLAATRDLTSPIRSASVSMARMPRPPPPQLAFSISG